MDTLIEVKNLKKYFRTPTGTVHAVDDVSFTIGRGETVGVVGESGCGKSTLGRTIIRLLEATDGQVLMNGEDVTHVRGRALRALREKAQIIFQDPFSSLDPRKRIDTTVKEPLRIAGSRSRSEIDEQTDRLMELVGIDKRLRFSYPHELDGGRRQRVGIARALALDPEFIVCDEPVSALDVSIQAQVLNLLMDLQEEKGLSYMFVTHDLSVVRHISDSICVMYLGQIAEISPAKEIFRHPLHPYTKILLSAIPTLDLHNQTRRIITKGEITSPIDPKPGCRFAARCAFYDPARCDCPQTLRELAPSHFASCCRAEEVSELTVPNI